MAQISILKPLFDLLKQGQIHYRSFVWLRGIESAPLESKRDSLEKLEVALKQITTQADSVRDRVVAMREMLVSEAEAFQNGHDPDPEEEHHDTNEA